MEVLDHVWAPLDHTRRALLVALGGFGRRLVRERELRVGLGALLALVVAFVGATVLPVVLLALGPILLGVPHVLSDVRYLVVRRGLHRRTLAVIAAVPLLASAIVGHVWLALAGAATVALFASTSPTRRAVVAIGFGALAVVAARHRYVADLVFAHAHNAIAVVLWLLWRPRIGRWHLAAIALYVLAAAAIVLGLHEPWLTGLDHRFVGFALEDATASLVPAAWQDRPISSRLVILFAFAQSIHYAVWLRLVPDDDRERATPRTFRASWRALRADLGPWLLGAFALTALGVAVWALVDLGAARHGYLRAALFHGQLELMALALVATEGRPRPGGATRPLRIRRRVGRA